jgi:hypothetical protein
MPKEIRANTESKGPSSFIYIIAMTTLLRCNYLPEANQFMSGDSGSAINYKQLQLDLQLQRERHKE